MKKLIYLIIAFSITGCIDSKKNLPEEFDFGKTENGVYTNHFFEMEIPFNPDWVVQSKQQLNNLIETGSDLATGDDKNLKAVIKASKVNTAYLFTIFKYEVGSVVDFNPSFMVVAENIKNFPGIKNGEDYLLNAKKLLKRSQISYHFDREIFTRKIGGLSFHIMEAKLDYLNTTLTQEYVSTVTNGFSLSFIISYMTDDQKKELYEILENIKI